MTLDYKKMFLIVTEEAVVKGHFTSQLVCAAPARGAFFASIFVEGFVRHMAGAHFLHSPLERIPGIFPVGGCIAVVIFRDQPIQIIFHPDQIILYQRVHRIIEPLPLAVGKPFFCRMEQLRKMVQAEAFAVFHPAAKFRFLQQHKKVW